jgi:adenosylcobyric acid synthase
LGLLPVVTIMAGEKTTTQVRARPAGSEFGGPVLEAYEIHMGVSEPAGAGAPAFTIVNRLGAPVEVADGWAVQGGRIWGTYLHGLFDNDHFRRSFLRDIRKEQGSGTEAEAAWSFQDFLEGQLDRLADLMRRHLDLALLKSFIEPDHAKD